MKRDKVALFCMLRYGNVGEMPWLFRIVLLSTYILLSLSCKSDHCDDDNRRLVTRAAQFFAGSCRIRTRYIVQLGWPGEELAALGAIIFLNATVEKGNARLVHALHAHSGEQLHFVLFV